MRGRHALGAVAGLRRSGSRAPWRPFADLLVLDHGVRCGQGTGRARLVPVFPHVEDSSAGAAAAVTSNGREQTGEHRWGGGSARAEAALKRMGPACPMPGLCCTPSLHEVFSERDPDAPLGRHRADLLPKTCRFIESRMQRRWRGQRSTTAPRSFSDRAPADYVASRRTATRHVGAGARGSSPWRLGPARGMSGGPRDRHPAAMRDRLVLVLRTLLVPEAEAWSTPQLLSPLLKHERGRPSTQATRACRS